MSSGCCSQSHLAAHHMTAFRTFGGSSRMLASPFHQATLGKSKFFNARRISDLVPIYRLCRPAIPSSRIAMNACGWHKHGVSSPFNWEEERAQMVRFHSGSARYIYSGPSIGNQKWRDDLRMTYKSFSDASLTDGLARDFWSQEEEHDFVLGDHLASPLQKGLIVINDKKINNDSVTLELANDFFATSSNMKPSYGPAHSSPLTGCLTAWSRSRAANLMMTRCSTSCEIKRNEARGVWSGDGLAVAAERRRDCLRLNIERSEEG